MFRENAQTRGESELKAATQSDRRDRRDRRDTQICNGMEGGAERIKKEMRPICGMSAAETIVPHLLAGRVFLQMPTAAHLPLLST